MAYNPYTRLLLKFDGSAGDSSEFAHPVTYGGAYALTPASDPFGGQALQLGVGGGVSYVQPVDPSAVFSQLDSYTVSRTIDLWVAPSSESGGLLLVEAPNEFAVFLYIGDATTLVASCADLTANWNAVDGYFDGEYGEVYADVPTLQIGWHHVRVRLSGQSVTLGVDGVDHGTCSLTISPVFKGGLPVDRLYIGRPYGQPLTAQVDSVQFLEGDNSWTGGSYTVPAQPDSFGSELPELFGAGANTLENTTTQWVVEGDPSGAGANTVGDCAGAGAGVVYAAGSGFTDLDAVTSSTPEKHNLNTRLLLNFESLAFSSSGFYYANSAFQPYTIYTTPGTDALGVGASIFSTAEGFSHAVSEGVFGTNAIRVSPAVSDGISDSEVTSVANFQSIDNLTKRVDLWFKPEATPVNNVASLLSFGADSNNYVYVWYTANAVGVNIKRAGSEVSVSGSFTCGTGTWRHIRVLIAGGAVKIAIGGAEIASGTLSGEAWPAAFVSSSVSVSVARFPTQQLNNLYGFRGLIDSVEILEGDTSWTGGGYTVPTKQPLDYDALVVDRINGTAAAHTVIIGNSSTGILIPITLGQGSSSLEDLQTTHTASTETYGAGANTLDPVGNESGGFQGLFTDGSGGNTLEALSSSGTAIVIPRRIGAGQSMLDDISALSNGVVWYMWPGVGANTVGVESTAAGTVTSQVSSGSSTVSVSSSGAGVVIAMLTEGSGSATVDLASSGIGRVECLGQGASAIAVESVGNGVSAINGTGATTTEQTSRAQGVCGIFASGGGSFSVASLGYGLVPIFGAGSSDTSVFTPPPVFYGETVFCVSAIPHMPVITRQKTIWVRN